jgi:hypothetical protein
MTNTIPTMPALTAAQITVTADRFQREVLVIPDEIARHMEAERKDGWHEAAGWAWGDSRYFPAGSWMYQTIITLMDAYAASAIPAHITGERDLAWAKVHRGTAARHYELRPMIVGTSDWNPDTRGWHDYRAHEDLHVFGCATKDQYSDAYKLCG